MSRIDSLKADIGELEQLLSQAERAHVKEILGVQIRRLQTMLMGLSEQAQKSSDDAAQDKPVAVVSAVSRRPHRDLHNYGWDQSEKFMKIYVTMTGIHNHSKDNIECSFTKRSFKMQVQNLEGKDYTLHIGNLHADIIVEDSYHKVKTDMVLLMLKKQEAGKTWPYVIKKEDKTKENKKSPAAAPSEGGDPGDSLMTMLKQMYDDGDDDMKRTISKAWTESRNKSPDLPL